MSQGVHSTNEADDPNCNKPLRGYRVGLTSSTSNYARLSVIGAGAEILHIFEAPSTSKEEFHAWWNTQAQQAHDEGVVLVVLDSQHKSEPWRNWLKEREEAEWDGDGADEDYHVRFVTRKSVLESCMTHGKPLVDSWGDIIRDDANDESMS